MLYIKIGCPHFTIRDNRFLFKFLSFRANTTSRFLSSFTLCEFFDKLLNPLAQIKIIRRLCKLNTATPTSATTSTHNINLAGTPLCINSIQNKSTISPKAKTATKHKPTVNKDKESASEVNSPAADALKSNRTEKTSPQTTVATNTISNARKNIFIAFLKIIPERIQADNRADRTHITDNT